MQAATRDFVIPVRPWAGVTTAPLALGWLLPECTNTIDHWYVRETPEMLWILNDTLTSSFGLLRAVGSDPGSLNVNSV